jgi:hypothetical protein
LRWSDLFYDRARLAVELSRFGIEARVLATDIRDVPGMRERCEHLDEDACLLLALQWFGDQGYPQPPKGERTNWNSWGYNRDWGRLPPLDEHVVTDAPKLVSNDRPGMKRRTGPDPVFHDPDVVARALSVLAAVDVTAAAGAAGWKNKKDVLRAEKLERWGLLRRARATLWVDPERVWQRDGKVSLRVLSADGLEWLDPLPLRVQP